MNKLIFFFLILSTWAGTLAGQETDKISLTGRVVNKETEGGVEFANLGVEGTYIGVACDANGSFNVSIPSSMKDKMVAITAMGFTTIRMSVADLAAQKPLLLKMESQSYKLSDVEVTAQSRVAYGLIKEVIDHIGQNYWQGPLFSNAVYRSEFRSDNAMQRIREADVEYSDRAGYKQRDYKEAFADRGYRFSNVKRSFQVRNLADGMTNMDDLLNLDIVRCPGNVLDREYMNDFDLSTDPETMLEGKPVFVVRYSLRKADFLHSGDFNIRKLDGRIYISKDNYAILKNEFHGVSDNWSEHGRSYAVKDGKKRPVSYDASCVYTKYGDSYVPRQLSLVVHYSDEKTDAIGSQFTEVATLDFSNYAPGSARDFAGRVYFEDLK